MNIDGTVMHVILAKEQKRKASGKPAGIVFSKSGFQVLNHYIQNLLPRICHDKFNGYVFPRKSTAAIIGEPLTLQEHTAIMKSVDFLEKTISSRTIRGSYVTIDRKSNSSMEQRRDLADSMSHSLSVADS